MTLLFVSTYLFLDWSSIDSHSFWYILYLGFSMWLRILCFALPSYGTLFGESESATIISSFSGYHLKLRYVSIHSVYLHNIISWIRLICQQLKLYLGLLGPLMQSSKSVWISVSLETAPNMISVSWKPFIIKRISFNWAYNFWDNIKSFFVLFQNKLLGLSLKSFSFWLPLSFTHILIHLFYRQLICFYFSNPFTLLWAHYSYYKSH